MSMTGYSDLSSNNCHLFGHCVGELAESPATSWFYGGYIYRWGCRHIYNPFCVNERLLGFLSCDS